MKIFNWLKTESKKNITGSHSYSQCGEDILVDFWLEKQVGFYVDIGANHPINLNNTYMFYKKGWSGINIEPDKNFYSLLKSERPRDTNLNIAISNAEGIGKIHTFKGATLNTMDSKKKDEYISSGNIFEGTTEINQVKLSTLLAQHSKTTHIDFMSIDVEGLEIEVLKSNDWSKFRPSFLIIETVNNNPIYKVNKLIDLYLIKKNYLPFADTFINTIYASKEFLKNKNILLEKLKQ